MKIILSVALIFLTGIFYAQDISIEPQKFPFSDIVEWPEHGLVLFAKDPSKTTIQQELTYVDETGTVIWQEHYLPMVENPYLIASGESDYMYFFDQIQPDAAGKMYYNQVSLSGYIKKGSLHFPSIFRTLQGVAYENCQLLDIIDAHDDLIFHFREANKKDKLYTDVLVFFHHGLLKPFPVIVPGAFLMAETDAGTKSLLNYAGSKEGENYFSYYSQKQAVKGYNLVTYNEKGELTSERMMSAPDEKIGAIQLQSNQLNGAYYLKTERIPSKGELLYYKGHFYLAAVNATSGLSIWKYENDKPVAWVKNIAVMHKKSTTYAVGVHFLNGKVIVFVESDEAKKSLVFDEKGNPISAGGESTENYERNPSQLFFAKNPSSFVIQLNNATYEINKQTWPADKQPAVFKKR